MRSVEEFLKKHPPVGQGPLKVKWTEKEVGHQASSATSGPVEMGSEEQSQDRKGRRGVVRAEEARAHDPHVGSGTGIDRDAGNGLLLGGPSNSRISDRDPEMAAAREAAISYICVGNRGAATSGNVKRQLLKKGFDEDLADEIVRQLRVDGYIVDHQRAVGIVCSRTGRRAESRAALRLRMRRLGIPDAEIEEALESSCSSDLELAKDLLASKFSRELGQLLDSAIDDYNDPLRTKLIRACCSRGFTAETAITALRSLTRGE